MGTWSPLNYYPRTSGLLLRKLFYKMTMSMTKVTFFHFDSFFSSSSHYLQTFHARFCRGDCGKSFESGNQQRKNSDRKDRWHYSAKMAPVLWHSSAKCLTKCEFFGNSFEVKSFCQNLRYDDMI